MNKIALKLVTQADNIVQQKVVKNKTLTKELVQAAADKGKSRKELAVDFGVTYRQLARFVRENLIKIDNAKKFSNITKDILENDIKTGMSMPEIAAKYQCSTSTIREKFKTFGLKTLEAQRAANITKEKLEELILQGADHKRIAQEFGIFDGTVTVVLKKFGLSTQKMDTAKAIRKQDVIDMYEAGASNSDLPQIFGISEIMMYKLLRKFGLTNHKIWQNRLIHQNVTINKEPLSKMLTEGKSIKEIAESFGTTARIVNKKIAEYGLEVKQNPRLKTILPDNYTLHSLINKDKISLEELANDFDISVQALKNYLKRNSIKFPQLKKLEQLTEQHSHKIAEMASEGYTQKRIAKELNLSIPTVSKIMQIKDIKVNMDFRPKS